VVTKESASQANLKATFSSQFACDEDLIHLAPC